MLLTKKPSTIIATMAASAALTILAGTSAVATSGAETVPDLDQDVVSEISERLDRYEVPEQEQQELLEKFSIGEQWDSLDPDVNPVTIDSTFIDGVDYTIKRFPDGSIHASGIERPSEATYGPDGTITGCTVTNSGDTTFFQNCRVADDHAIAGASFSTNYQMNSALNQASVTSVDRPNAWAAAATISDVDLTILRPSFIPGAPGMAGDPAIGQVSFTANFAQEIGSYHLYLQVRVTPGAAIPASNFVSLP